MSHSEPDSWEKYLAQPSLFDDHEAEVQNFPDPFPVHRATPVPTVPHGPTPPDVGFVFKFLISYHYFRNIDLDKLVADVGVPCQIFADCGAFSAKTQGVDIDIKEYAQWCDKWSHLLAACSNLDVIGDGGSGAEQTARNQATLEALGVNPLPVFHVWEDERYLHQYCEQYPYLALGGMVGYSTDVRRWLARCFEIAAKYGTVFHGFGQTSPDLLWEFPWYSADSTAWSKGYRFGTMDLWDPTTESFVDCQLFTDDVKTHADLIRSHGGDPIRFTTRPDPDNPNPDTDYHSRYALGVALVAWTRFARCLRAKKTPVPLRDATGLDLYLAAKEPDVKKAGQMLPTVGPHLYMAGIDYPLTERTLHGVNLAATNLDTSGPHLYLVDAAPTNLKTATAVGLPHLTPSTSTTEGSTTP